LGFGLNGIGAYPDVDNPVITCKSSAFSALSAVKY
jgi:hypothetical protein